jgi:hypothetical protein
MFYFHFVYVIINYNYIYRLKQTGYHSSKYKYNIKSEFGLVCNKKLKYLNMYSNKLLYFNKKIK